MSTNRIGDLQQPLINDVSVNHGFQALKKESYQDIAVKAELEAQKIMKDLQEGKLRTLEEKELALHQIKSLGKEMIQAYNKDTSWFKSKSPLKKAANKISETITALVNDKYKFIYKSDSDYVSKDAKQLIIKTANNLGYNKSNQYAVAESWLTPMESRSNSDSQSR